MREWDRKPESETRGDAAEHDSQENNLRQRAILRRQRERKLGDSPTGAAGAPTATTSAAPATNISKGATGILSQAVTVKVNGQDTKLDAGTVVQVASTSATTLTVKVQSGHGGAVADIPANVFQAEPGVAEDEDTNALRDDVYQDHPGMLWGQSGPKPEDVAQGYIGDCYLMSSMAAVVGQNPQAIKRLFSPQTPNASKYTITLYQRHLLGNFTPVTITVDTQLPSLKDQPETLAYAGIGKDVKTWPLWPSLLEKAYAIFKGTYAAIGNGGFPVDALESLTGVKGTQERIGNSNSLIQQFKQYEKDGKAVVVGTRSSMKMTTLKAFNANNGAYSAQLTGSDGGPCAIVKKSLHVDDNASKHTCSAVDDGKGHLHGSTVQKGTVDYKKAAVSLSFNAGAEPDAPTNLTASYKYEGLLSKSLNIYSGHAYRFERVDDTSNKIILKNPWGVEHPEPLTPDEFRTYYSDISTDALPSEDAAA